MQNAFDVAVTAQVEKHGLNIDLTTNKDSHMKKFFADKISLFRHLARF